MKTRLGILAAGLVLVNVWGALLWYGDTRNEARLMFLDVGQGDAILISYRNQQVLIDGGASGPLLLERLGRTLPFWDRSIDAVIATHPDQDHIGGLTALPERYQVGVWLTTHVTHTTQAFQALGEAMEQGEGERVEAKRGTTLRLGDDVALDVLFPFTSVDSALTRDTNTASVAVLAHIGGTTFFLGGDLPAAQETRVHPGEVTVLKASHHGSKSSTPTTFLDETKPRDVVLSVGTDNRYGHPASEVLERLSERGIRILRTDTQGTITYLCPVVKGSQCVVETER